MQNLTKQTKMQATLAQVKLDNFTLSKSALISLCQTQLDDNSMQDQVMYHEFAQDLITVTNLCCQADKLSDDIEHLGCPDIFGYAYDLINLFMTGEKVTVSQNLTTKYIEYLNMTELNQDIQSIQVLLNDRHNKTAYDLFEDAMILLDNIDSNDDFWHEHKETLHRAKADIINTFYNAETNDLGKANVESELFGFIKAVV